MHIFGVYTPSLVPDYRSYTMWFDPKKRGQIIFPHWVILREYWDAIGHAPIGWYDRTHCYLYTVGWMVVLAHYLTLDLIRAAKQILERFVKALVKRMRMRAERPLHQ